MSALPKGLLEALTRAPSVRRVFRGRRKSISCETTYPWLLPDVPEQAA